MADKVGTVYIKLDAESAGMLRALQKAGAATKRLGRTVDRQANKIKYAFNKLRRAAQVVASAFIFTAGVRQLGRLVSSMAQAEDRVKLMQARFQQFARTGDAFTRIYNLARNLGVSLEEAAGGMTRLLVATKDIGTAQETLEQVYQNIVLLGRAGGTSTAEMVGGMRQLSQGLASGRLAGEELRSVLENLPLVAMEIAKQMGISLGALRAVAAEGKIVPEIVIAALSEIEVKMEDLPKTWAMQTENLRTEWDLFLADLSKAVDEAGLLRALTDAVQWVRFNMLGSFTGISTDDLQKDLAAYKAARDTWNAINKPPDRISTPKDNAWFPGQDLTPQEPGWLEKLADIKVIPTLYGGIRIGSETGAEKAEIETNIRLLEEEIALREKREKLLKDAQNAKKELELSKPGEIPYLKEISIVDPADRLNEAWERINKGVADYNDQLKTSSKNIKRLVETDAEKFVRLMAEARELLSTDNIDEETFDRYREHLLSQMEGMDELKDKSKDVYDQMQEYAKQAARNIQDAFADFFYDFDSGLDNMVKSFLDALRRMLANQLATQLVGFIKRLFNPAGETEWLTLGSDSGSSGSSSILRAKGGPVDAGKPYVIGERGMEIFVPATSGRIMPAHDSKSFAKHFADNSIRQTTRSMVNVDNSIRQTTREQMGDTAFEVPGLPVQATVDFDEAIKGMTKEAVGGNTDDTNEFFKNIARKGFANPTPKDVFPDFEKRESGGPVAAGKPYVVGEAGAELFIPGMAGQVIPNGAAIINNYSFAAGADVATIRSEIIPMLERTKEATKAEWLMMRSEGRV